MISNVIVK